MSLGILGLKVGMTQIYDDQGIAIPVTVVEAGPCTVVALRRPEIEKYTALVLGFGKVKPSRLNKPLQGVFKSAGVEPKRWLREFRVDDVAGFEVGQTIDVSIFEVGEVVDVTGTSKGKGYAGVMKRHGFGGGPASHGASLFHRRSGSSGANSFPSHVFKGKTMPGRMGNERVTVKNLSIVAIDKENNLLLIKGAIPGPRNGLVVVRKKEG
ncbi:MAG TPA: 50S ribosomal protein L3 [Acetomicrobium flavidum]|uniref:Large ribosomal subunit protein uL3 n=2 Tax=Acetomicrobium TaxID=49894 RepID=I4BV21_ACEMN|nr:50S ribosomal protein L3 [Acetomicrobium mobile]NLG95324.1 50S ribosomal protein L3 [Acetomicrobium flavidum]AFM21128.1 50S ribosomal protein L3, bacterial [Acetomicrobium mobile DSM 13181]SIN64601.1 LSU ribosomal protein L3P [Acetomicrobium flavidum]HOJ82352.1 50S ribosomal protein L3 [Acetomicrobium flavidum]HOP88044.1 50S ribosomal protein L3 [Acetomicrobium flavidum]